MTYNLANKSAEPIDETWKLYKRRWFIMILFMIYTMDGSLQWGQFTIISNLVSKYYNVSETLVEWTANVFYLFYVLFIIPALYVLDKLVSASLYICIRKSQLSDDSNIHFLIPPPSGFTKNHDNRFIRNGHRNLD